MDVDQLRNSPIGELTPIQGGHQAFVPSPLPRRLSLSPSLILKLDQASRAVATLAGVGETIPNPHLLARPFMRREAVLSSRIEGTQASLSDLLAYEASHRARGDVREVVNYITAIEQGIGMLDQLPICIRLADQLHSTLMAGVRGHERHPGELRDEQVWIGSEGTPIQDARFIPPPANRVLETLGDWERFANEPVEFPPLVQCALLHYQFEAIHPYLDGNGRIGRLLIILFLCAQGVLPTPLLYLSAYFERDRQEYYNQLLTVSATGDWEAWLNYFLTGVEQEARDALARARKIRDLHNQYRTLLQEQRVSGNTLRLLDILFEQQPYMTAPSAARLLDVTDVGARNILGRLVDLNVLEVLPDSWPAFYTSRELIDAFEL